jgi:stage V sporulation protein R
MLIDSLYHPPKIDVNTEKTTEEILYLVHAFEGKQLIKGFIPETLVGIEFLWGGAVSLETTEIVLTKEKQLELKKVLYTINERKVTKTNLE